MFDEYAEKLKSIQANVPKVFKTVATRGAKFARDKAVEITDKEGLVDTGAYKGKWNAEKIEPQKDVYGVLLENNMEYASHLEEGYRIKKQKFIPFDKMEGTPKTKALIAAFKAKYPEAKGFVVKPRRFKGKFIGRRTLNETHYYCIQQLDKMTDKLFEQYHRGFTQPD